MKATNSLTGYNNAPKSFSAVITAPAMQSMIEKSLKDPARCASFTSTLISIVSSSWQLKNCDPNTIVSAALRGEGMNLSLALGQYSVVPYGDKANFQISYKGVAQLAIRSGLYKTLDVYDVRDGEYKGRDPRTRQPIFEWIEDEDERARKPIIGYYGVYELTTGFFNSIYWTHEKILDHANRYSKAFSKDKYEQLLSGKLSKSDADKLRGGSPWYNDPDSEGHQKMCKKTILLQLLGDGKAPLSIEMQRAMAIDRDSDNGGVIFEDSVPKSKEKEEVIYDVDTETGEVVSNSASDESLSEKPKSTRQSKKTNTSDFDANNVPSHTSFDEVTFGQVEKNK